MYLASTARTAGLLLAIAIADGGFLGLLSLENFPCLNGKRGRCVCGFVNVVEESLRIFSRFCGVVRFGNGMVSWLGTLGYGG